MKLIKEIQALKKSKVRTVVNKRLREFEVLNKKSSKEWFSELCYCILTANSKAITALSIQKELGAKGFCSHCQRSLSSTIKRNKHRFHNNKAKFIVEARRHTDIKQKLKNLKDTEARAWLVKNIKGLGYKEASHFMRNVGYKNLAILDRHILGVMGEEKKAITKKRYLSIEKKFQKIAGKVNMSAAKLDLYVWYMKTGKILK